ncbi:MAG: selenite/tellurite reduction operon b-type cytochrome iron-sulfur cluster-binding subunit ExtO [Desulfuromonadaceae bacterium]|nr:selenite/tellurite reduction operon b-type cytochrome iron-sulfur cluster-binding subunit ExtO [Desulfuromonadaceae bacterium]MDD5105735.1 selenite/tellurite reduction operon b-type cytochrome iron-sulfur cluster-binding subunit ExtO [Desulfuromonadaceae bacterium]
MILYIAVCFLTISAEALAAHGGLVCVSCHRPAAVGFNQYGGCAVCHRGHQRIFDHAMGQRSGEKQFVQRSYGRFDSGFWNKNCDSCHLQGCRDCHGDADHIRKPTVADCQICHRGYYTGWDYSGRAPREDNMRYQRGIAVNGETFLKMLPDVHYSAGMLCGACHSMASLAEGKKSSKECRDCHIPDLTVAEHRIAAHLEKLECSACHSAWAPQEYGTFFLRFRDRRMKEDFDLKAGPSDEYLRSAYLRSQDTPPLGINSRGRVSPIRPLFIAYYTDIMSARNNGPENVLLAAQWRAWFPHTIQRGTVTCEGCHDAPRRFLLEPAQERIYQLNTDGLGLESFWSREGQSVANGSFMPADRFAKMSSKSPTYTRAYIEKWKAFLNRVDTSSPQ